MSIYIGLIILDPISNKTRYSETINEIKHFLQTYQEELLIEISAENKPSEDIKLFSYVVWECCCIFKENFPSKIELFQENLDQVSSIVKGYSLDEILRRQISTLNSRKYANDPLRQDEIEDVFCILDNALKRKNIKGITVCLNILNSNQLCHIGNLKNLSDRYIKTVESVINLSSFQYDSEIEDEKNFKELESNKQIASNLLVRISTANQYQEDLSQQKKLGTDYDSIESKQVFEKPLSIKTSLFQLNESNDINRIVFLLDNLITSHLHKILQSNFQTFFNILTKILNRYSNGDFGFDNNENSKYCILQNRLFKCLLACLEYHSDLPSQIDPEVINIISQIMEECCLYIIQNLSNFDRKHEFEYKMFFDQSYKLFEILISNNKISNIDEVTNSMKSILDRIKMYFSTHNAEGDFDPDELGFFCNDLKTYYEDIKHLLLKGKTLVDIASGSNKKKPLYKSEFKENYYQNC